jgi:hypothetical protein
VKNDSLTPEEKVLFISLQGIVNRNKPILYLDIDNYLDYLNEIEFEYVTLEEALTKYRDYYHGYTLFDFTIGDISINLSATIASALDYLSLPTSLGYLVDKLGLNNFVDLRCLKGDYIDKQEKIFDKYQALLRKDGLIHQVTEKDNYHISLRDYGIANRWFCFYTDKGVKAKQFREKVLNWANRNIPIYGWTTDEIDFVNDISKHGNYIIPSDWSCNHSALDKFPSVKLKQKEIKYNIIDNKHYLTIVVSDGDNVQWLERDFSTTSSFGQRIATDEKYPIGWTIAPSMVNICPTVIERLYKMGENNYFISGASGAGYMNPCAFPESLLDDFCKKTSELMSKCDLNVVTLLDNLENEDKIHKVINKYAKNDNLIGGIYELDPSKYEGGKGNIYFASNGKPFASVRVSFWSPDGMKSSVTEEWIQSIANKINAFKVDKKSKEGYTVLNVHPWSTTIEDLDKLVSLLENHVQIIKVDDFLRLIKENVEHNRG